jgi:hypothetical protein
MCFAVVWIALRVTIGQSEKAFAAIDKKAAVFFLDFEQERGVKLMNGAKAREGRFGKAQEFTTALQYAEVEFSKKLDGIQP